MTKINLPNFLVLGPPRTGTTWLFSCIHRHPEIFIPDRKQIYFFNRYYHQGVRWYASLFEGAPSSAKKLGDITPDYLAAPEAPLRILETLGPDVELFLIFREPVERAFSEYAMKRRAGIVYKPFLQVLSEDRALRVNSLYAENTIRFMRYFGDRRLHIMLYDKLKDAPENFLLQFLTTLGVDPSYRPRTVRARIAAGLPPPRSRGLDRLAVGVRQGIEKLPRGREVLWFLRERGLTSLWHRVSSRDEQTQLSAEEWVEASTYFKADQEEFGKLIGSLK